MMRGLGITGAVARTRLARAARARLAPAARLVAPAIAIVLACVALASHAQVRADATPRPWVAPAAAAANASSSAAVAPAAPTAPTLPRYAIVTQDSAALRASPHDNAPTLAVLWQGDALEIRGQKLDYLQIYDHRRERGGFVRAALLRATNLDAADAPGLLAVVRFVRDTRGAEALGLAYAAGYLKAAPAGAPQAEAWDAMGQMAERLARRASSRAGRASVGTAPTAQDAQLSGQLEGVAAYGVKLVQPERDGGQQLCYDGEAFGRVLTVADATPEQKARAVLALTRPDCQDPDTPPTLRREQDQWRAQLLQSRLFAADWNALPDLWKNRVLMRRAGVLAAVAFSQARRGAEGMAAAQTAAVAAIDALAGVRKTELADDDQAEWTEAAMRVSASRWAAIPAVPAVAATVANTASGTAAAPSRGSRVRVATQPGAPGETCVLLLDAQHDAQHPLQQRCTYGLVWTASASTNAAGSALALAVQTLAGWRELWLYRRTADGWVLDVLPPATGTPALGTVEFAGWVPGTDRLLLAREAMADGRVQRGFEVVRLDTLSVDKQASTPALLAAFKWQDPAWKAGTVVLR